MVQAVNPKSHSMHQNMGFRRPKGSEQNIIKVGKLSNLKQGNSKMNWPPPASLSFSEFIFSFLIPVPQVVSSLRFMLVAFSQVMPEYQKREERS